VLDRAFDWYRIVNVKAAASTVETRKLAAQDLAEQLSTRGQEQLLLATLHGIVLERGFHASPSAATAALAAIKAHDSAVPADLKENALELRACSAIAIGELLHNPGKGVGTAAVLAALAVRSALMYRLPPKEKHLSELFAQLAELAEVALSKAADERRQRVPALLQRLDKIEDPSDPTNLKSYLTTTRAVIRGLQSQATVDREELDALWWLFSGYSSLAKGQLSAHSIETGAYCAAMELADIALLPPLSSMQELVVRATDTGRSPQDCRPLPLLEIGHTWYSALLKESSDPARFPAAPTAQIYPALTPLSWTLRRLAESEGTMNAREVVAVTGIGATQTNTPSKWGAQLFNEKILHRYIEGPAAGTA
jgi:hypothetical protein